MFDLNDFDEAAWAQTVQVARTAVNAVRTAAGDEIRARAVLADVSASSTPESIARGVLDRGEVLCVFPEGTRSSRTQATAMFHSSRRK